MIESRLHTYSMFGTILSGVAVVAAVWLADEAAKDAAAEPDPYANMVVIDAALAEKSTAEQKQPQKELKPPPEPVKPIGVSRDENAAPVTEPEKPKPEKPDIENVLNKHRSDEDEDLPVGKPEIEIGRVDGVEIGYGDKTYGDPYLGALKSAVMKAWEFPEILSDVGTPLGCIQLEADGTIEEIEVKKPSGNAELDDSVERALTELKKKTNLEPKPLPKKLEYLTRMQLCWRMKV